MKFTGEGCPANADLEFALDIRSGGLKAGEADLGDDFAQAMDQDHAIDGPASAGNPRRCVARSGRKRCRLACRSRVLPCWRPAFPTRRRGTVFSGFRVQSPGKTGSRSKSLVVRHYLRVLL